MKKAGTPTPRKDQALGLNRYVMSPKKKKVAKLLKTNEKLFNLINNHGNAS